MYSLSKFKSCLVHIYGHPHCTVWKALEVTLNLSDTSSRRKGEVESSFLLDLRFI
jgi:hypothetical protein